MCAKSYVILPSQIIIALSYLLPNFLELSNIFLLTTYFFNQPFCLFWYSSFTRLWSCHLHGIITTSSFLIAYSVQIMNVPRFIKSHWQTFRLLIFSLISCIKFPRSCICAFVPVFLDDWVAGPQGTHFKTWQILPDCIIWQDGGGGCIDLYSTSSCVYNLEICQESWKQLCPKSSISASEKFILRQS